MTQLRLRNRNRSYEECYQELDVDARDNAAFRRGYERGWQYLETFRKHRRIRKFIGNQTGNFRRRVLNALLILARHTGQR